MTGRWHDAPTELTQRHAFVTIWGPTGSGRTTLALTMPGPVALLHDCEKLEGIVQPAAQRTEVKMYDFSTRIQASSTQEAAKAANKVWVEFKRELVAACEWARTIVLDTHTAAWELHRYARFGKLTQVKPYHYPAVNQEWMALMTEIRDHEGVNFVGIGREKAEYKGEKATGDYIQAGQKNMEYLSDVVLRTDDDYDVTVTKPWWNGEYRDEVLPADTGLPTMLGLITESDPAEWGAD